MYVIPDEPGLLLAVKKVQMRVVIVEFMAILLRGRNCMDSAAEIVKRT